jgi:hypothetical protein
MQDVIINFPPWVHAYASKHGVFPDQYQTIAIKQDIASIPLLDEMQQNVKNHPLYQTAIERIDSMMNSYNYEGGFLISISESRENFDNLYSTSAESRYRGGLQEIKIGDHFVLYGFDFD